MFKAAVVEYSPDVENNTSVENIFKQSLSDYIGFIEEASLKGADIIVFPEYGLTSTYITKKRENIIPYVTIVPSPEDKICPCDIDVKYTSNVLRAISYAAKQNNIYVVINLPEVYYCKEKNECPPDEMLFYNTNVVFNRKGVVVARYRKFNLFVEPAFNTTKEAELCTFTTDFGVTFGVFICYDILFQHPAVDLVRNKGVRHFIYSTAWLSKIPFLTAVQVQAGWASSNGVALIASGYDNPTKYTGGSGIYVKDQLLTYYIPTKRGNKILFADVPKVLSNIVKMNETEHGNGINEMIFFNERLDDYNTELLDFSKNKSYSNNICNGQLCCSFNVEIKNYKDETLCYRAVVFDGYRFSANTIRIYIQVCGIVAYQNKNCDSCGITNSSNIQNMPEFEKITIEGNFIQSDSVLQMPSTLNLNYLPLNGDKYNFSIEKEKTRMVTKKSVKNVLTFGIYSRHFSRDKF